MLLSQHVLSHGTTVHGAQSLDPKYRHEPLTYYHRESPLGQVFAALPDSAKDRAALVGLGTGSIAAYGGPGARWTFFEVDPRMERLARDSTMFTYLRDSRAAIDVVLGDARLTLTRMANGEFDLIVLDAFTSDAIPIHLITREAVRVYLSKLAHDGLLIFHISNRYLNLQPVLAQLAADAGLVAAVQSDEPPVAQDGLLKYGSTWVVMARDLDSLRRVASSEAWRALAATNEMSVWTDDFSNILSVLKWRLRS
jgi:spermidine synthase